MFVLGSAVIYVLPVMVSVFKGGGMEPITAWRISLGVFAVIGAVCCIIPAFVVNEKDYIECIGPLRGCRCYGAAAAGFSHQDW